MSTPNLTSSELRTLLDYDPNTGVFTWRETRNNNAKAGAVAGSRTPQGYLNIHIRDNPNRAHRLAWLYVHGVWPTHNIDHINGDRADNRIANLRDVTQAVNQHNQRAPRGANPYLGVHHYPARGQWRARIWLDGKQYYLGAYATAEEARDAYLAAKRRMHEGNTL